MSTEGRRVSEEILQLCDDLELGDRQCTVLQRRLRVICKIPEEEKGEKKRSPYQQFMSVCLKKRIPQVGEASSAMKDCAKAWREQKGG